MTDSADRPGSPDSDDIAGSEGADKSTNAGSLRELELAHQFHDYAVAFVDLLGQQEAIANLTKTPRDANSRDQLTAQLSSTALVVRHVRDTLRHILASMSKGYPTELQSNERFARLREQAFEVIGFSDSFVVSVSLKPHDEFGYLKGVQGVYSMLEALGVMQLASLANEGVAMRGGVDVGGGIRIYPGEIYGPALLNAYRLESQRAQYPRIVVGEGLCAYLAEAEQLADSTPEVAKLIRVHVAFCREILCESPDDGQWMVDFLSSKWRDGDRVGDMPARAYAFVKNELARHRHAHNQKLEARYGRLLNYFGVRGFSA